MHNSYFQLEAPVILRVSGRDALRYVHARLSNDIKGITSNLSCYAAALSPQGKTEALFVVLKRSAEELLLICDGGEHAKVQTAFQRYIVADKVSVENVSHDFAILHYIGETSTLPEALPIPTNRQEGAWAEGAGFSLFRQRTPKLGIDLIIPKDRQVLIDAVRSQQVPIDSNVRTALRILANRPEFPIEINDQLLFSEANFFAAISHSKGCYVGQEVIEKISAMGMLPRRLCRLSISEITQLAVGSEIVLEELPDKVIGKLLSSGSLSDQKMTVCFGSIKNQAFAPETRFLIGTKQARLILPPT